MDCIKYKVKTRLNRVIAEVEEGSYAGRKRDEIALLVSKEEMDVLHNLYGFTRTIDSSLEYHYPSAKYDGYKLIVV